MSHATKQMSLEIERLSLPALIFEKAVPGWGRVMHQLQEAQEVSCSAGTLLPNRRKYLAWEYECKEGHKYLLTTKRADRKLDGYRGILFKDGEDLTWLRHDTIEAFEQELGSRVCLTICDSWSNQFIYRQQTNAAEPDGLRPPQIGALHAISAHWSLSNEPATIVMPTGTGKTETMLSALIESQSKCMLVVVPSVALKGQTANKFVSLGMLPELGVVPHSITKPVVGIIDHQITSEDQLKIFEQCNVVVAVVNSFSSKKTETLLSEIADCCSHLVLDEAHHVAAASWNRLKTAFSEKNKPVFQFTATPFREDHSPLGGKVIYNYPLGRAQDEGYFLPIKFQGVFEVETDVADRRIAETAVAQLRADLELGYDHRLLARCQRISRAEKVLEIYRSVAPELNPTLVHSQKGSVDQHIEDLRSGACKIVVTVNMLSEGFDLPSLKVAAIHDTFKSLAVTLQFAGRFPRVGSGNLGTPTIVANTGIEDVSSALQGLYDEDADWDSMLKELQFEKVAERLRFEEFNRKCRDLDNGEVSEETIAAKLNAKNLNFRFNTVVYRNAKEFNSYGLRNGLEKNHRLVRSWQIEDRNVAFYVTRLVEKPRFSNSKLVEDSTFNLYAMYYDAERELLHIGSSTSSMNCHENLAKAVSGNGVVRIRDEQTYRIFCKIESLMLLQVGLLSGGGARNHRYSMFAGADVKDAIARIHDGATKSNFFGDGFQDGGPVGIGCSSRGKIWGRDTGSLDEWVEWCNQVATELLDGNADTSKLIDNVLLREIIPHLPTDKEPWFIEWPERFNRLNEYSLKLSADQIEEPLYRWGISLLQYDVKENCFDFTISHSEGVLPASTYRLSITGEEGAGFAVSLLDGPKLKLCGLKQEQTLEDFFKEYPPILDFIDHSFLEGANFVDPKQTPPAYSASDLDVRDWTPVNIRKESRWKGGVFHEDSIQAQAMQWCLDEGFEIIVDDDGANEVADIVAVKEEGDGLRLRLLHCKYSATDDSGARIEDVVEVSSQAVKNIRWMWDLNALRTRLNKRDKDRTAKGASRYFRGDPSMLKKVARISQIRPRYEKEVVIVQPGISASKISGEMSSVLGSADAYIRTRLGCKLKVWCST